MIRRCMDSDENRLLKWADIRITGTCFYTDTEYVFQAFILKIETIIRSMTNPFTDIGSEEVQDKFAVVTEARNIVRMPEKI